MSVFSVVNAFNAGELSPRLLCRPDIEHYSRGCRVLENFLPTPYGSAERRPGTAAMATVDEPAEGGGGRLARFVFDSSNAYLLLFTRAGLRAYRPGTEEGWYGVTVSGAYPWAGLDMDSLAFCQVNDVMCIVHPEAAPMRLSRVGAMEFVLDAWPFDHPPMLDQNVEPGLSARFAPDGLPQAEASYAVGATGTLVSSGFSDACFGSGGSGWEGRFVELEYRKAQETKSTNAAIPVYGAWTFTTHGTWSGTVRLMRKAPDDADFAEYLSWSSQDDFNVAASGDESEEGVLYKVSASVSGTTTVVDGMTVPSATGNTLRVRLSCPGWRGRLLVRATGAGDPEAGFPAEVVRAVVGFTPNQATMRFSLGAFCGAEGFPRAACLHQERLWLAGTARNPQRLWGSRTNSLGDFQVAGGEDDSGIDLTLAGEGGSRVCWMASKGPLLAGTEDEEWSLAPGSSGAALTASSLRCTRSSVYGSAWPPAWSLAEDRLVFAQRDRARLRGMLYSWEQDGFVAEDVTLLAEHVTRAGVRCLAVQKSPDTVVWCALSDGTLASCTCDASQRVNGWARHPRAGEVLSLAVLPTPAGEDRLYLLVRYGSELFVERMFPRRFPGFLFAAYLDCAMPVKDERPGWWDSPLFASQDADGVVDAPLPSIVEKLTAVNLDLETASAAYDTSARGFPMSGFEATDGWCGLPYESRLSPMPAETQTQRGLSMLRQKTVCRMLVDLYSSLGGEVRAGAGAWRPILPRDPREDFDAAPEPKDEVVVAAPLGGHERRATVEIRQSLPLPLNVAGLSLELSSEGV